VGEKLPRYLIFKVHLYFSADFLVFDVEEDLLVFFELEVVVLTVLGFVKDSRIDSSSFLHPSIQRLL
jgi:hypothetical protein